MLAAVKEWPGGGGVGGEGAATAILDGVCARRHGASAGRDEETVLRSNKETDQEGTAGERAYWNASRQRADCGTQGVPRSTTVLA